MAQADVSLRTCGRGDAVGGGRPGARWGRTLGV